MNEFAIITLPKVNLQLAPAKFEINSLKMLLQSSPACHHNLKTIERQKILKQSTDIFVKYRKKKTHVTLKEYLNNKRSYSTRQHRKSEQNYRLPTQQSKQNPIVLCKALSNRVQTIKQMKNKKQIYADQAAKMHKGNLYNKLIKKNVTFQQHFNRLQRCHRISSLAILINEPGKVSQSPTSRNLDQMQLIRRRFMSQKRSLGSLSELKKGQKYFKNTVKDFKIQGWNMKQSKNGFGIEQNL